LVNNITFLSRKPYRR